jgi:electron transfer flavoprotein alpha subunit
VLAVIPVRDGAPPAGADETLAECGGVGWLVGSGAARAALDASLAGPATDLTTVELGDFEVARWTATLTAMLPDDGNADALVLPNSPDGRDLAPRLAFALGRPLFAGATIVTLEEVTLLRRGGLEEHAMRPSGPFVATLQPGVRGPDPDALPRPVERRAIAPAEVDLAGGDARVVDVLPPDVSTMDLTEAHRIVGGGAGLDSEERFVQLGEVATAIGASMGATRVITDRSWVAHDKQIGTTGLVVDPDLYLAFGISGAVQHTSGLGHPDHVISVNTDPHCPMMQMSDLAIVTDANATLDALHAALVGADRAVTLEGHAGG